MPLLYAARNSGKNIKATIALRVSIMTNGLLQKNLNPQEKAQFVNVSRWFDNLQQDANLRQKLESINFDLLHLYLWTF